MSLFYKFQQNTIIIFQNYAFLFMQFQKEWSMPGKAYDNTDEDYDVKTYRVRQ